jgi:hypothetical protein
MNETTIHSRMWRYLASRHAQLEGFSWGLMAGVILEALCK